MKKKAKQICERLSRIKTESGMSSHKLGIISGTCQAYWCVFKARTRGPFESTLCHIADSLRIDLNWLRTGKGSEPDWVASRKRWRLRLAAERNKIKLNIPMKKLSHSDMLPGDHAWAFIAGKLVVVMRVSDGYEVCGPWECGAGKKVVDLVSRIPRPTGFETTPLYYDPKESP